MQDGACRTFTRNGHDWSAKCRRICAEALQLGAQSAVLYGEVIILGEKGHPDFKALRHAIVAAQESLVFVAFDLLHLNGHDLRRMHLAERRAILADLVPDDGAIPVQPEPRRRCRGPRPHGPGRHGVQALTAPIGPTLPKPG
ncbi:hypothetical protein [Tianweitania sediminis]|uniref:ATP-dependent DNA ligase n=1 Tax=Tianweitania sediminis TaxID=1502156 RepID=UPI0031587D18